MTATTENATYTMSLDLSVLNHLGLNLYSNVAAVLAEAVANAWDADSPEVQISLDSRHDRIEINDSGRGMTIEDANNRFLNVGYNKRSAEGDLSPGGRALMGRKGIGKLSLFSIAHVVDVVSAKDGHRHGFRMAVADIEQAILEQRPYHPQPIALSELPEIERGTHIRLSDLQRRATSQTASALRKRIARRFSVIGRDFRVFINGAEVTIGDRDDLAKAQFLWLIGDPEVSEAVVGRMARTAHLGAIVNVEGRAYSSEGWIGSARKPRDLDTDEAGNLNSIVVFARGRLVQENILDRVNIAGLFTKYLTGQINADFLDINTGPDIATSDRQRIIEDDPRYQGLLTFVRQSLNAIESQWAEWRAELGTKEVVESYPRIQDWIGGLPETSRSAAKKVMGTIQSLSIDDEAKRRELLRQGVLAFERLRLKESTDRLVQALERSPEEVLSIVGEQDDLEAALYFDIVRGRLQVISSFAGLVDANAKERVLQKFLFDHLWLLDPAWERAAGSERMEQRVHKEFESLDAGLTEEERKGRLDIKYRTMAGRHVIIELKRYSVVPSVYDLAKQGAKYVRATEKLLKEAGQIGPVEMIFVIGSSVKEDDERSLKALDAVPGRIRTYEQLIQGALAEYSEFSEKRRALDSIEKLFEPA